MMSREQMVKLLDRSLSLPCKTAADVFLTAAVMAEAVEGVAPATNGHGAAHVIKATPRKSGDHGGQLRVVTKKSLRDLGLTYPTVADCAHDLVGAKGMTIDAAAKRMGATPLQVRDALSNWQYRNSKPTKTARAS